MVKFQIRVDEKTFKALRILSQEEFRDWRLQAGFLIREALNGRGLLVEEESNKAIEGACNEPAKQI